LSHHDGRSRERGAAGVMHRAADAAAYNLRLRRESAGEKQ
jgi:hypothetical protein